MTFFKVKNLSGSGQHLVKRFSEVGLQELFMSRLFNFTRIIDGLIINDAVKRQDIKEKIMKMIFEGFEPAFVSLCELQKAENNNDYPENKIEKHAKDIISYLAIAYKDRMQKVAASLGYDIGFLCTKDINFEQGVKKFTDEHIGERFGWHITIKS